MPGSSDHLWSDGEVDVLARAMIRAPSVHNIQPWSLTLPGLRAELSERTDVALSEHDPRGRDRLISCGAALANLILAVRVLGWRAEVTVPAGKPPLVAVVTATGREPPSGRDLHLYAAISRRRSHRRPFAAIPVASEALARIIGPKHHGVVCRVVQAGELEALAGLLESAARTVQNDPGSQRELAAWTSAWRADGVGDGLVDPDYDKASLPWAGLVRETSLIPERRTLAERLARETLLIFCVEEESRSGHVWTGVAMQRAWLAAVDGGLAASVLTQPLHGDLIREGLIADLELPAPPQVIMRLGYPAGPVRRTARLPVSALLRQPAPGSDPSARKELP